MNKKEKYIIKNQDRKKEQNKNYQIIKMNK